LLWFLQEDAAEHPHLSATSPLKHIYY